MKASVNRVERQMKEAGIQGYRPPSFKRTTVQDASLENSPNLAKERLDAVDGINQLWVSDISVLQQAA